MSRLFFALWPDDTTRKSIAQFAESMNNIRGKKVQAVNFHITLSFLGEVEASRIDSLLRAAGGVRGQGFELVLDKLDCFSRSRIMYMGCSHIPGRLKQLVCNLEEKLAGCGYVREKRPYTPHVTLARKYSQPAHPQGVINIAWSVKNFSLVESRSGVDSVGYHVLQSWPLQA